MRTAAGLVLLFSLSLMGQQASVADVQEPRPIPPEIAADVYQLYSEFYRARQPQSSTDQVLVVARTIRVYGRQEYASCIKPKTKDEQLMVENFFRYNWGQYRWDSKFDIGQPYYLVSASETERVLECRYLQLTGKPAEGCAFVKGIGYVRFLSIPGFNRDRTRALVAISRVCGGLCGEGGFSTFFKTAHGWEQEQSGFATCRWIY